MSEHARPNILLIVTHDLGTRLGCYGETSVRTPRIDALAAQGMRLDNHFATACFCSPSRGSLITGKHPHVNGLMGLVNLGWTMAPGHATDAPLLSAAGYETHLLGLQHEAPDSATLGFDHVWGESNHCDKVAARAAQTLAALGESGETPWYMRIGFAQVHRPYENDEPADPATVNVPAHMRDTPGARQDLAMMHGAIGRMDHAVGDILDALDASDQADDTLVVFTTDHGIAFPRAKATLYDPGLRVAMTVRLPGVIAPGSSTDALTSHVDVLPTFLQSAGAPVPEDMQGRSLLGLLRGERTTHHTQLFAGKSTAASDVKRSIRTATHKYILNYHEGPLLALPTDVEASLTRRDMGNDHLAARPAVELYDLQADPDETQNLAGDSTHAGIEAKLADELNRFQRETHDPILRGPLQRPAVEREKVTASMQRCQSLSAYPREQLRSAFDSPWSLNDGRVIRDMPPQPRAV